MNARALAEKIWADVTDRSGNGFENVDDAVKEEILSAWTGIIGQFFGAGSQENKRVLTVGHIRKESPRAAEWERIFGGLTVPLISPISFWGNSPAGTQEFYQCDLSRLSTEQRARVVEDIMARFSVDRADVEAGLNDPMHGLPIRAEDVSVTFDGRLFL